MFRRCVVWGIALLAVLASSACVIFESSSSLPRDTGEEESALSGPVAADKSSRPCGFVFRCRT
jgi:hypothetical protein